MPKTEKLNLELVRRIFEDGWNRGVYDFLDGATASEIPFHYNGETLTVTPDSLPGLVAAWRGGFPDLWMTIRHIIAQDDLVAVALTLEGTHEGIWMGIPGSGRAVIVEEMMFFRFEEGILVEMWEVFDEKGLRDQIESSSDGS